MTTAGMATDANIVNMNTFRNHWRETASHNMFEIDTKPPPTTESLYLAQTQISLTMNTGYSVSI